jgi:hypothetical protein
MNIALIETDRETLVGVVEWPDGVTKEEIARNYAGSVGIRDYSQFDVSLCPVIPWAELKLVNIAYCDQKWVIKRNKPIDIVEVYWNETNLWETLPHATVYNGYQRQEKQLPSDCHWVNLN